MQIIDTGVEGCLNGKLEKPAPYYAKVLEQVPTKPGCWNYTKLGVFDRSDKQRGEYTFNYSSAARTFHPFQLRGEWYALYARDYTSTRLMRLPSCEDIGGEERDGFGFCPTDYFVPVLSHLAHHKDECPRNKNNNDFTKPCSCPKVHYSWMWPERIHGFVAGCVWGDDSSWKIQYLDLSQADKGVLKRDDRFGYIELPEELTLDKAVKLDVDDENMVYLTIACQGHFQITGEKVT